MEGLTFNVTFRPPEAAVEVAVGCVVDVVPGRVFPERGADVGAVVEFTPLFLGDDPPQGPVVVGAGVLVVGKRGVVLTGEFSARAEDAFDPAAPQAAARRPRQASHGSSLDL